MNLFEAIILGVLQGATEFLPVSSSGHLVLGGHILGLKEPQLLFDITLHVGTLISVMLFYRRDIFNILTGFARSLKQLILTRSLQAALEPEGTRLALLVLIATIPTGLLGLALKDLLEPEAGARPITPMMVCGILILNGFILKSNAYFARREAKEQGQDSPTTKTKPSSLELWRLTPLKAAFIGVMQGIAILPGISRSGMTITTALALRVEREHAARYSFLLSIPAILGALVLKFDLSLFQGNQGDSLVLIYWVGALAAAIVGYGCLILLTHLLKKAQFHHFAWYCWLVGGAGLIYFLAQ